MSKSSGNDSAPALMLSNSLGTNLTMWDDQVGEWSKHFRVIRYDRRGHGGSDAPQGPYSMERFGRDVIAVLDALNVKKTNWCGLSMGGMVGQWLGANAPDRIEKLILSNTSCHYPDPTNWNDRVKAVQEDGMAAGGRHGHRGLVHRRLPRTRTAGHRQHEGHAARHPGAGLPRLLRSDCHDSTSARAAANHAPDFGDRRAPRQSTPSPRAKSSAADQGRQLVKPGRRAYFQHGQQPHAFTDAVVGFLTQR